MKEEEGAIVRGEGGRDTYESISTKKGWTGFVGIIEKSR